MPKYKHVNYKHVCDMVKKVTLIKGSPQPLRLLVDDLSRHTGLGIDTSRVRQMLGDKVVEKVEQDGDVRRVTTLVIP
jgi:hypothetical protein